MRVALVLLSASAAVFAQDDLEMRARVEEYLQRVQTERFETVEGLTLVESARIDYGVYTTLSGLAVDDEAGSTRVLGQVDSRFWAHASYGGHEAYGRLRLRYRDFDGDDSFDGEGDDLAEPIGDRWWYRFSLSGWREGRGEPEQDFDAWVQAGRQYVPWAAGIVLSETLYAARAGVSYRRLRAQFMYAQTPRTGTIDFDASRPGFDRHVERHFWGLLVEYETPRGHTPYVYLLDQDDENDTVTPVLYGYDSTYAGVGGRGPLCGTVWYRVEGVYEFGSSMSDAFFPPQMLEDISAWAAMVALEYMPRTLDEYRVRFELEFLLASGDEDRGGASYTIGGNIPGTDDEQFNGFGYAYTGLALAPDLSNLLSIRATASAFPLPGRDLRVSLDVFGIFKMDEDAPMSVSTLVGHKHVGIELDLAVEWQVFGDLAVDFRYGIFFPGSAIPHDEARHFAYLAVSYGF